MKNIQKILQQPSLRREIEKVQQDIRGKNPEQNIDNAIEFFSQQIVKEMEVKNWGIFLPRSEQWFHDLLTENLDFFNEQGIENDIRSLEKKLNEYLQTQDRKKIDSALMLISLVGKIMIESRLAIHNLSRPESNSPGIGSVPAEAFFLNL